jgi:hypothetical protein
MTTRLDRGADEAARHGVPRSPKWPEVERTHLTRQRDCVCCKPGEDHGAGLQVHHIFPFHYCVLLGRADLELDDRNLITLCENETGKPGQDHHLLVGHLDDFKSSNLSVVIDARKTFFGMLAATIRVDPEWLAKKLKKLAPIDRMTREDKTSFTAAMNAAFPR